MKQTWALSLLILVVGCGSDGSPNDDSDGASSGGASSGGASSSGGSSAIDGAGGSSSAGNTPLFVGLGTWHGCAITSSGGVKCWGLVDKGALGHGISTPVGQAVSEPVAVTGLDSGMVAVTSGDYHSCALSEDGAVKCWGDNYFGQLGNDSKEGSAVPVDVVGLPSRVLEVRAGNGYTCAKVEDATLWCWGANRNGELGDGSGDSSGRGDAQTPREVPGLGAVRSFALGEGSTCAVTQDGSAKCWGKNNAGQLGVGTTEGALSPAQVVGLETGITGVSVGASFTCAITEEGTGKCWGQNTSGQLGNGSTEPSFVPVDVLELTDAEVIQAGYVHTCALLADSSVKCWGSDTNGQLGSHTDSNNEVTPGLELSGVVQLSTNGSSNCAVLSSPSTIQCWGSNSYGKLGNDAGGTYRTPRTLPGF